MVDGGGVSSGVGVQSRLHPFEGKASKTAPATTDAQSYLHRRRNHMGDVTISGNRASAALYANRRPSHHPTPGNSAHGAAQPATGVGVGTLRTTTSAPRRHRPRWVSYPPTPLPGVVV